MPTYEYRCEKCGNNFEVFQSFTARPLRQHQECGGRVEKVFHPRGVVFKGSGFYVTDSRKKSDEGPSSTQEKAETPKSDKAKSDTTPAAAAAD
ncbi:MAG: FmdB family zinc ribbon protein [Actinomycetota bacterium]